MAGYSYPSNQDLQEEEELGYDQAWQPETTTGYSQAYYPNDLQPGSLDVYHFQQQLQPYQHPHAHQQRQSIHQYTGFPTAWASPWFVPTPVVPSNGPSQSQTGDCLTLNHDFPPAGPSRTSAGYLPPEEADRTRSSRAASNASSHPESEYRSESPNASQMLRRGIHNTGDGSWKCAFPGCASRSIFSRGCDLRKHYKRHTKSLFCRHEGCQQATKGGFSSNKDRARHEAKHNPKVGCEWDGCERLFSRVDNMKDHVRRVHRRRASP